MGLSRTRWLAPGPTPKLEQAGPRATHVARPAASARSSNRSSHAMAARVGRLAPQRAPKSITALGTGPALSEVRGEAHAIVGLSWQPP